MRGVLFQFEDLQALACKLEENGGEQELELPGLTGVREGEWLLVTITVGEDNTSVAACAVDRGDGLRIAFANRDWERLLEFAHVGGPPSAKPPDPVIPISQLEPPAAHVLIVDDDDGVRAVVASVLSNAGYLASGVGSAEEAFDRLRTEQVDLVVLDWCLPGVDGVAFCRRLRDDPRLGDIPVLLMSSHCSPCEVSAALAAGADDFVGKPFRAPELGARLLGLLRRSQLPVSVGRG
ncbi:MAG: response regulator [Polyangiaceae bacterium]|nr:response regulator [Polyangiaceae bacterium]